MEKSTIVDIIKNHTEAVMIWVRNTVRLLSNRTVEVIDSAVGSIRALASNPKQTIGLIVLGFLALDLVTWKVGIIGNITNVVTSLLTATATIKWEGLCALVVVYFIVDRFKTVK